MRVPIFEDSIKGNLILVFSPLMLTYLTSIGKCGDMYTLIFRMPLQMNKI